MSSINFYDKTTDGEVLCFDAVQDGGTVRYALSTESFRDKKGIEIYSDAFEASVGDEGYYLVPGEEKMSGTALIRFKALDTDERLSVDDPTVNASVKGNNTVSQLAVFGGRPALYVYSKFVTPVKTENGTITNNWMGEEDLFLDGDEALKRTVEAIYAISEEYKKLSDLQNVFIDSFKHLGGALYVARYEDGTEIAANLGDEPAAVYLKSISRCAFRDNLVDHPGVFWYYDATATRNEERQISKVSAIGLYVTGNQNKIIGNTFSNSSRESVRIEGAVNILMTNIADGDVIIDGEGNTVNGLAFTKPDARLILRGAAKETTLVLGVDEKRIVKE